jgi:hypothetical protein
MAEHNAAIFNALDQTMRYLYFYCHLPIIYPHQSISKKTLTLHWARGSAEYLAPEDGTGLINFSDADHASDIGDHRSASYSLYLLNGILFAWRSKKQTVSTLHSCGSELISLASGVKNPGHIRDFTASAGHPFC